MLAVHLRHLNGKGIAPNEDLHLIAAMNDTCDPLLVLFEKLPAQDRYVLQQVAGNLNHRCLIEHAQTRQVGSLEDGAFLTEEVALFQDIQDFAAHRALKKAGADDVERLKVPAGDGLARLETPLRCGVDNAPKNGDWKAFAEQVGRIKECAQIGGAPDAIQQAVAPYDPGIEAERKPHYAYEGGGTVGVPGGPIVQHGAGADQRSGRQAGVQVVARAHLLHLPAQQQQHFLRRLAFLENNRAGVDLRHGVVDQHPKIMQPYSRKTRCQIFEGMAAHSLRLPGHQYVDGAECGAGADLFFLRRQVAGTMGKQDSV